MIQPDIHMLVLFFKLLIWHPFPIRWRGIVAVNDEKQSSSLAESTECLFITVEIKPLIIYNIDANSKNLILLAEDFGLVKSWARCHQKYLIIPGFVHWYRLKIAFLCNPSGLPPFSAGLVWPSQEGILCWLTGGLSRWNWSRHPESGAVQWAKPWGRIILGIYLGV